ncbi:molybdenum cofactor biosynthesis protein MoaE [Nocardioides sp. HDW12B]|uniref:molybdenum cofactor biosynthesis protein MoaE n=1 Tax=Nocardioides sp. HDW12B TaxID=2714939 RepID=UPI00140E3506|nr:molybdenum cofactor biosynthesis protein MoaE [Nocardioides sp. HDW12B]QIK67391.1 molybdenum cofactor biosynthesis protein MoaE [Nocardioides sp. HDW12B]
MEPHAPAPPPSPTEAGAVVRLVDIRETALDVAEVLAAVEDDAAGGVTLFVGNVRNHDGDQAVDHLDYSAHPSALDRLREVVEAVAQRHSVTAVAAVHRVGRLAIGDAAVVVAAAAPHRGQAFDASRDLIDDLKATVPIWKHQVFSDGGEEWVGTP